MDSEINKIYERVRTWSPLNPHDLPIIQKSNVDTDVELNALDSRIASLQADLDLSEKQRSSLSSLSNGYHTLLPRYARFLSDCFTKSSPIVMFKQSYKYGDVKRPGMITRTPGPQAQSVMSKHPQLYCPKSPKFGTMFDLCQRPCSHGPRSPSS